jgi:zinc protease
LFAQTLPAGVQKAASMGGITEYDFPTALKVLLYPDQAQPKITVNVTYLVDRATRATARRGWRTCSKHMDFIETTNGRKIKEELVAHGANWNGTTSDDPDELLRERSPPSDENLKWALSLETDRMVNVKFTKQILDTEMTVVRNEFERGENSPASILRERVASTAYLWHNYGKSTIGSKDDLEKVPYNRLAEFYKKYYQPGQRRAGHHREIDEAKTLQMVADTMGRFGALRAFSIRPTRWSRHRTASAS